MQSFTFVLLAASLAVASANWAGYYRPGAEQQQRVYLLAQPRQPMRTGQYMNKADGQAAYYGQGQAQGQSESYGQGAASGAATDKVVFDGYTKEFSNSKYDTTASADGTSNTYSQQKGATDMQYKMEDGYGYASAAGQSSQSFETRNDAKEQYNNKAVGSEAYGSSLEGSLKAVDEQNSQWQEQTRTDAQAQFAARDETQAQAESAMKDQVTTHESNVPADAGVNGFPVGPRIDGLHAGLPVSKYSPAAAVGHAQPQYYVPAQQQQAYAGAAVGGPVSAGQWVQPDAATLVPAPYTSVHVDAPNGFAASHA